MTVPPKSADPDVVDTHPRDGVQPKTPDLDDGQTRGTLERWIARVVAGLYARLRDNRVTHVPWAVIQTFSNAQGALLSGSMAYYTFLSLLPLVMVAGYALGMISSGNVDLQETLVDAMDRLFPGDYGSQVLDQLIRARAAFGIIGVIAVTYAGSGFVGALTACLNQMWDSPSGRNPVGQKIVNLLVVNLLGVALLGSVAITVWVTYAADAILDNGATSVGWLIETVASPLSLFGVLLLLYRLLPAVRLSWSNQIPGAIFGAAGIEILKRAFAFWAEHSAGVSALPRSLLSVVLLLVWLGFFAQLILYGAALNVVLHRRRKRLPLVPEWDLAEAVVEQRRAPRR